MKLLPQRWRLIGHSTRKPGYYSVTRQSQVEIHMEKKQSITVNTWLRDVEAYIKETRYKQGQLEGRSNRWNLVGGLSISKEGDGVY